MGAFDLFAKYSQNGNMLCKISLLALLTLVFQATDSDTLAEDPEYYGRLWNEYPNGHGHEYEHLVQDDLEFTHAYMTPYRWLAPQSTRAAKPPGCQAVQLYLVARHGERNPDSVTFIEERFDNLETVLNPLMKKSTGVSPSVNVEFPWRSPFLKEEIGQQIPEGDIQMYNLARRFAKRFPELLRGRTSVADFNFTSSFVLRVTQSATAFGLGYLKGTGHVSKMNLQPIPITSFQRGKDRLHRWIDDCPRWQKTILNNNATTSESKKFLKSYTFQKIVHKVREKLGLVNVKEVDENIVLSMFRACGWSVQAFGDSEDSGWCSLFTPEDQKIYDFYVDLYIYNLYGPGNQVNPDQSCVLVQDIFNNLKRKAEEMKGTQTPASKAVFRFGHAETVISPLNKLGLFLEGVPFTADNYERLRDRAYRTGMIAPMGGNVAFVLYKCVYGEYKIQFYHHERLTKLPGCPSKMHCTLKELLSYYEDNINECANQFEQVCKV